MAHAITPEHKAKLAEAMRAAWADPDKRAHMVTKIREATIRRFAGQVGSHAPLLHDEVDPMEPADPWLMEMVREARPRFRILGDDREAVELLLTTITCELPIRRALLAVRLFVKQYGLSAEMAGQLALITDALVELDPELGPPETLAARLAIIVGVRAHEVVGGQGVSALVPV